MPKLKNILFIILLISLFAFFSNKNNTYAFSFSDWFSKDNSKVLGDDDSKEDEQDEEDAEDKQEIEDKEDEDEKETEDINEIEVEDKEDSDKDEDEKDDKYEYEQNITNDDGTQTWVKIKKESGKEKVEVKKYDIYGNKISESKFESENKIDESESKLESETNDFEKGVFSNIKLETKDKKVLELKTSKSKDLSKVEFEVAKGEMKIKYKDESESEIENEVETDHLLNVKVSEDGFELEENSVVAKINFPISIDEETGKIYIQTKNGEVVLSVLPEMALRQITDQSKSFTPDKVEIEENDLDDKLTYNITGKEKQNLLGLFSVDILKTFNVDATDATMVSEDQSFYNKILDLLSI